MRRPRPSNRHHCRHHHRSRHHHPTTQMPSSSLRPSSLLLHRPCRPCPQPWPCACAAVRPASALLRPPQPPTPRTPTCGVQETGKQQTHTSWLARFHSNNTPQRMRRGRRPTCCNSNANTSHTLSLDTPAPSHQSLTETHPHPPTHTKPLEKRLQHYTTHLNKCVEVVGPHALYVSLLKPRHLGSSSISLLGQGLRGVRVTVNRVREACVRSQV